MTKRCGKKNKDSVVSEIEWSATHETGREWLGILQCSCGGRITAQRSVRDQCEDDESREQLIKDSLSQTVLA